uniref:Kinesin-like protein n=1 Tax=Plectus sambesii TaxID=2011161 RepID=A0A914VQU9_9BILA
MSESARASKKEKNKNIQVAVRVRPLNESEKRDRARNVVDVSESTRTISVKDKLGLKTFPSFDRVYGPTSTQVDIYRDIVAEQIGEVLLGYNCTVFAYGQTGTGKTFTMEGEHDREANHSWDTDPKAGIIPRALHHLFNELEKQEADEYTVRISYVELYNEELMDLIGAADLEQTRLRIYEDPMRKGSVVINGMEEVSVRNREEVYSVSNISTKNGCVAPSRLCRSHSVFTVTVTVRDVSVPGEELLRQGKLHLVDLAGSECIGRSGAVDKRAREAGNINQSLLTLGRVITALTSNAPHIPYRESKLTRLLQDSLGGRTITTIIATVSPASTNVDETLSTLEYAQRAKNIKNHPEINQKLTRRALLMEYNDEIERLRRDLVAAREKNGIFLAQENYDDMQTRLTSQTEKIEELEGQYESVLQKLKQLIEDMGQMDSQYQRAYHHLQLARGKLDRRRNEVHDLTTKLSEAHRKQEETTFFLENSERLCSELHHQATQLVECCSQTSADLSAVHDKLDVYGRVQASNRVKFDQFKQSTTTSLRDYSAHVLRRQEDEQSTMQLLKSTTATLKSETTTSVQTVETQISSASATLEASVAQLIASLKQQRDANVASANDARALLTDFVGCVSSALEQTVRDVQEKLAQAANSAAMARAENDSYRQELERQRETRISAVEADAQQRKTDVAELDEQSRQFLVKMQSLMDEHARAMSAVSQRMAESGREFKSAQKTAAGDCHDSAVQTLDKVDHQMALVSQLADQSTAAVVECQTNVKESTDELAASDQKNSEANASRWDADYEATKQTLSQLESHMVTSLTTSVDVVQSIGSRTETTVNQVVEQINVETTSALEAATDLESKLAELGQQTTQFFDEDVEFTKESGSTPKRTQRSFPKTVPTLPDRALMESEFAQLASPPRPSMYRVRESILDPDVSLLLSPSALKSALPSQQTIVESSQETLNVSENMSFGQEKSAKRTTTRRALVHKND